MKATQKSTRNTNTGTNTMTKTEKQTNSPKDSTRAKFLKSQRLHPLKTSLLTRWDPVWLVLWVTHRILVLHCRVYHGFGIFASQKSKWTYGDWGVVCKWDCSAFLLTECFKSDLWALSKSNKINIIVNENIKATIVLCNQFLFTGGPI